jgi:micrococcal nuclease
VEKSRVRFDDGDTVDILWDGGEKETVRLLGIDTPEIAHPEHGLPVAQPYGERAAGFLEGCLARSEKLELLDRGQKDPYGRTLGYLFLDGQSYSVLVLRAGLAAESVSHYGNNGFPAEAAACLAAAAEAGPLPFEPPHEWRKRFRTYTDHQKARNAPAKR